MEFGSIFALVLFAVSSASILKRESHVYSVDAEQPDVCEYNGQQFKEGEVIRENACGPCHCFSGMEICPLAGCPPPSCVDPDYNPDECCPYSCPNGENCYAGDILISAGEIHMEQVDDNCVKLCQCVGFGYPAECSTSCTLEPIKLETVDEA